MADSNPFKPGSPRWQGYQRGVLHLAATNGELGLALTEAYVAGARLADCLRRLRDDPLTPMPAVAAALEAWERASHPSMQVAPTSVGGTDGDR